MPAQLGRRPTDDDNPDDMVLDAPPLAAISVLRVARLGIINVSAFNSAPHDRAAIEQLTILSSPKTRSSFWSKS